MKTNEMDKAIDRLNEVVDSFKLFTPEADLDGARKGLQEVAETLGRSTPLTDDWVDEHRPIIKPSNARLTHNDDPFPPLILLPALTDECEPQIGRDQCYLLTYVIQAAHTRATQEYRTYEETKDDEARALYETLRNAARRSFYSWVRLCCPDEKLIREVAQYLASPADDHSGHSH